MNTRSETMSWSVPMRCAFIQGRVCCTLKVDNLWPPAVTSLGFIIVARESGDEWWAESCWGEIPVLRRRCPFFLYPRNWRGGCTHLAGDRRKISGKTKLKPWQFVLWQPKSPSWIGASTTHHSLNTGVFCWHTDSCVCLRHKSEPFKSNLNAQSL